MSDLDGGPSYHDLHITIRKVEPGDSFYWCDREVVAERVQRHHYVKRPYVYVWITIDGTQRRLHYYADELVERGRRTWERRWRCHD